MPAVFQGDDLMLRWLEAFDDSLAPIFATLDNLHAYFDPETTPSDFLDWLGQWVGIALDETWPLERQRALLARSLELYRWRGTVRGLTEHIAIFTGVTPQITDSGGASTSDSPGGALPGSVEARLTVRLNVQDPESVDTRRIEAIVLASKPAHIAHEVEIATT